MSFSSTQRAVAPKDTMGKILNVQNAKVAEPAPIDRANVRRHNYSRLQEEIRAEGQDRDRRFNKNVFGGHSSNRENEISANRAKNSMSQLSFLAGG